MNPVDKFEILKNEIPEGVKLIVVSKFQSAQAIQELYSVGQRLFGENKVQELCRKNEALPADIEWHFIGHLQTNKVRYIAPFISMIHSVDSLKLLVEINREAERSSRIIPCLLQFYIAKEETKYGLTLEEGLALIDSQEFSKLKNVKIYGVMGMATFTENEHQIRSEFVTLKDYFLKIKEKFFEHEAYFSEISMGMTHDFHIAIQEGSTIVRIGSKIFS